MSEKTRAELKEQIKIMNHNYQTIKEMHERGYQYSIGEIKKLQDKLERTRKALDLAKEGLKEIQDKGEYVNPIELAESYLDEIEALEQKDVK